MEWHSTSYAWPFVLSALVLVGLLAYAWPRRAVPTGRAFLVLCIVAALWSVLSALQLAAAGLDAKVMIANLRYTAIVSLPVAWTAFALAYTGRHTWLQPKRLLLLCVLPATTLLLVATNENHNLMFRATWMVTNGPVVGVGRSYGPWFWMNMVYGYGLVLLGAVLITLHRIYAPRLYRRQATVVLLGAVVALACNLAFLLMPSRFSHVDLTPVAFTLSGVFFAWGLFRLHLLDLMPVAREAAFDSMPDGVVVLDQHYRVVDLNPAARRIFASEQPDIVGKVLDVLPRSARTGDGMEQAAPMSCELTLAVNDERRIFECRLSPLHNADAYGPHRLVIALLRDITDRRRADAFEAGQKHILERVATGHTLSEILDTLAAFAENLASSEIRCSILLLDEEGVHLRHGAAPHLPPAFTEAVDGIAIGPDVGTCGTAAYYGKPVVTADIATDPRWSGFQDLALLNGLQACWSMPIFSTDHRVLGTFAMYFDRPREPHPDDRRLIELLSHLAGIAVERSRYETQLIEAKDQAEEMARLKSAFLANMSHEIRTPLTSIIGFANLLAEELDTEHQHLAARIGQAGQRLLATLNSVLDYARLEAGKVEMQWDVLDVSDIVRETASAFLPQTQARGIGLDLEVPEHPAMVRLDRSLMIRVLNNLVENACKFTDDGGILLRVRTTPRQVVLDVQDTGCGIGTDFLPFVFDEFKQESSGLGRSHEGSGLGLRITKQLVERMRGTISVESRRGEGSTFTVVFPRCAAHGSPDLHGRPASAPSSRTSPFDTAAGPAAQASPAAS